MPFLAPMVKVMMFLSGSNALTVPRKLGPSARISRAVFWSADEDLQRGLAASWAGRMLARHPEATRVVVHLDAYQLPTMAEYKRGERPGWSPHYQAEFVRRATLGKAQEPTPGGNP